MLVQAEEGQQAELAAAAAPLLRVRQPALPQEPKPQPGTLDVHLGDLAYGGRSSGGGGGRGRGAGAGRRGRGRGPSAGGRGGQREAQAPS